MRVSILPCIRQLSEKFLVGNATISTLRKIFSDNGTSRIIIERDRQILQER